MALPLSQLFKEELTQVKEGMKHINDLAHQLAISDVHLSMENARSLEHLNSRWKLLQVPHHPAFLLRLPPSLHQPSPLVPAVPYPPPHSVFGRCLGLLRTADGQVMCSYSCNGIFFLP